MNKSTKTAMAALIVALIIVVGGVVAYLYLATGTLKIQITDPPAGWGDASQIYLNYSSIEVHRADAGNSSGWFTAMSQGEVNLTSIVNVTKNLGDKMLQPGTYNLIRFQINSAKVTFDEQNFTASVPSGKLQIAITQGGITINAGQTSTVLIELNIAVHGSDENLTIVPDIRAVPV